VICRADSVEWEPLQENRSWPTWELQEGTRLRTKFGSTATSVEVSAVHVEREARSCRDLNARAASALQENIDKKGGNAYYFAHNRPFEVPAEAKVVTGPGLITGGTPTLLELGSKRIDSEADRTVWLKEYSWSDSKGKVKVYVPVPEGILPEEGAEALVETNFTGNEVNLLINGKPRQALKIEKLNAEIQPDNCSVRVEAKRCRITLQLAKKKDTTWYSLTKK